MQAASLMSYRASDCQWRIFQKKSSQLLSLESIHEAKLLLVLLRLIQSWNPESVLPSAVQEPREMNASGDGPWPPWELRSEGREQGRVGR